MAESIRVRFVPHQFAESLHVADNQAPCLPEQMNAMEWKSDTEFVVEGVRFLCSLDDYTRKTDQTRIIILKDRRSLESYYTVLRNHVARNVLEFGVLEGGSAILFSLLLDLDKFVGVELNDPPSGLRQFLSEQEVGKRIRLHFKTSQTDEAKIRNIIRNEFDGTPLDLIIDDASHEYALTKRTFEIAFPHLRPGGLYVIEDWGWPHWKGCTACMGEPALSKLIFELSMVCATSPEIINDVWVHSSFAFIRKSEEANELLDFSIDNLYQKRGLYLTFEDFEARTLELEAMQGTRRWPLLETLRRWRSRIAGGLRRGRRRARPSDLV